MNAESLMKQIRKKTVRAKESLLESLGKADRTTDEQFEENCANFSRQQKNAERLQKELKNVSMCLKALCQASKGFNDAVREVYEPQWDEVEHVKAITHSLDLLWDDYLEKVNDQALSPLNAYCSQFADIKAKIDKRKRKLVDYDSARHNFDSMQASGKKDDKLQKAQEQLNIAKKMYDDINRELMTELPELYDGRVAFTVNHLQTIYNAEQTFHTETGQLSKELNEKVGKVRLDTPPPPPKTHSMPRPPAPVVKQPAKDGSPVALSASNSNHKLDNRKDSQDSLKKDSQEGRRFSAKASDSPTPSVEEKHRNNEEKRALYPAISNAPAVSSPVKDSSPLDETNPFGTEEEEHDENKVDVVEKNVVVETTKTVVETKILTKVAELPSPPPYHSPRAAKNIPPQEEKAAEKQAESSEKPALVVLKKLRATHRYTAEDTDELSFDAGDIISVVPYDDPEEQDDGWLCGVKESTGEKGVFPENFTKPL